MIFAGRVELAHRLRIEKFQRDGFKSRAHDCRNSTGRPVNRFERGDDRAEMFGDGMQFQGRFGDDAERAFRADEKMHQVISAGSFGGTGAGADDFAVRQDDLQAQDIVFGRAIAGRARPRRVVGNHPADARIRPRVGREKETVRREFGVHVFVRNARLDVHLKIRIIHLQDFVHAQNVEDDAARNGNRIAFDARARAPRRNRNEMRVGVFEDCADCSAVSG